MLHTSAYIYPALILSGLSFSVWSFVSHYHFCCKMSLSNNCGIIMCDENFIIGFIATEHPFMDPNRFSLRLWGHYLSFSQIFVKAPKADVAIVTFVGGIQRTVCREYSFTGHIIYYGVTQFLLRNLNVKCYDQNWKRIYCQAVFYVYEEFVLLKANVQNIMWVLMFSRCPSFSVSLPALLLCCDTRHGNGKWHAMKICLN